jgi:pimeloyl-ACP methyl ester carboxylesterase
MTTNTVELADGVTVTFTEQGDRVAAPGSTPGSAVLVLHGGAGPRSMAGLATALAEHSHVLTPTIPGFDGTPRPDGFDSIADVATAFLDLLDTVDVHQVLVIGNSAGGWIAAEMALRDNHDRISGLVLMDAAGILVSDPHEIADPRTLTPAQLGELSFHNPALRPNPATMPEAQRNAMAANGRTLAVYAREMYDPKLRRRLSRITKPVLVLWGESDGVCTPGYGRAYAESFPDARFRLIAEAGHLPHLEQPVVTLSAIGEFAETELKH